MKNLLRLVPLFCVFAGGCAVARVPPAAAKALSAPAPADFPLKPSGWLGIETAETVGSALRADLGIPPELEGMLVSGVFQGTPAQACGLAAGDYLVSLDGRPLSAVGDIKAAAAGSKVSLGFRRGGKLRTASCVLGYYPAALGFMVSPTPAGLMVAQLPDERYKKTLRRMGWPISATYIRSIDGRAAPSIEEAKKILEGRRPLETVVLELENANTKKPQRIEVKLNEGAPENRMRAEDASSREPRTLTVSAAGGGDFRTVAGALMMSSPGDTILLRAGRYAEPVSISLSRRTVRGEGPATVLEGGLFVTGTESTTVEDLSLENASGGAQSRSAGIRDRRLAPQGASPQAEKATITSALRQTRGAALRRLRIKGGHYGVYVLESQDATIENCVVSGAVAGLASEASTLKVTASVFHDNGIGVQTTKDTVGMFRGLTVVDNREQGMLLDLGRVELYDSIVVGTPVLVQCQNNCRFSGGYNNYHEGKLVLLTSQADPPAVLSKDTDAGVDPLFAERLKGDYRLSLESPLIGRGRGGGYIGALPPVGSGSGSEGFK